jgi:hypothetical protein
MEMASFSLKIRHVFGDTSLTERSIGAGPPVIIQLSDFTTSRAFFVSARDHYWDYQRLSLQLNIQTDY